jgi:hypothetical protein
MDLAIAATANVHKVPLLTDNTGDFTIIADLVDARSPQPPEAETETDSEALPTPTSSTTPGRTRFR